MKRVDRRLKTLDEHIHHAKIHFQRRSVYRQYQQQKSKKQAEFYESQRAELASFEAAREYLKQRMNGRTGIPIKAWKAEDAQLTAERQTLYAEYTRLKEEVRDAEAIRRCVEQVLRDEPPVKRGRRHEAEL